MKDDTVYIDHMLECIERIFEYTQQNKDQFYKSTLVQDAVVRNLQVMAESSQRLSPDEKLKYPEIPWREIAGFRNILVHDYLGLDLDVIWSVVEQDIPALREALKFPHL
ncbi:Uncharacterized conserved protein, contains HEPN domain [Allochromatium warmingii]|uniref:Uncharacterized conserved protein, contains HEPN domain n=1 Tax=Allochromatium warmingii TaxID=61595 RepID=A0A1H3EB08_ALLWA|nr:DUF86 domain-containing protein [Allochromatium warmingii]SDX75896.1 Uncharacterized conserved protein, contains HEPN domain [Allochromatium warmingii]